MTKRTAMGMVALGASFSSVSNALSLANLMDEGRPLPTTRLILAVATLGVAIVASVVWLRSPRDPNPPIPSLWREMRAFVLGELRR